VPGPLTQDRLEDMQVFGFLTALAATGGRHPLSVAVPSTDPPDRLVGDGTLEWGLEMSELTLEDVRKELGPIRALGRALQVALTESADHEHLRGQLVMLSPADVPPKDPSGELPAIVEALREDRGSLAEMQVDISEGLPEKLPDAGFYGQIGSFVVHVNGPPGVPGQILVAASTQAQVYRSEALAALAARINAKDRSENDLVLVTCGLPDKRGYVCGVDEWIFQILREATTQGLLRLPDEPRHLQGVAVHSVASGTWFEAYRRPGPRVPWE
jgi:hypothetical protein